MSFGDYDEKTREWMRLGRMRVCLLHLCCGDRSKMGGGCLYSSYPIPRIHSQPGAEVGLD